MIRGVWWEGAKEKEEKSGKYGIMEAKRKETF